MYVGFTFSISIVAYMIYIGLLHVELVHCHSVLRGIIADQQKP